MKRPIVFLAALTATMGIASAASAQVRVIVREEMGLELGVRSGYSIPMGEATSGDQLTNTISGAIPIWVDAGWRFGRHLMVGGYFQYGFGSVASNLGCSNLGISCSTSTIAGGVQATWHFIERGDVDGWLGIGAGYEQLNVSYGNQSLSFSGPQLLMLQGGVDFRVARGLWLGPFVAYQLAEYESGNVLLSDGTTASGSISNTSIHEWLTLGGRVRFDTPLF